MPVLAMSRLRAAACQAGHACPVASAATRRPVTRAGLAARCWARAASERSSSSLLWPTMAAASAPRRQEVTVAVSGQRDWLARPGAAWRSRSAVMAAPAHSSATVSVPWGSRRGGRMRAGTVSSSLRPSCGRRVLL